MNQKPASRKPLVIAASILLGLGVLTLFVVAVLSLSGAYKGHDWGNGLAPQRPASEIASIESAVETAVPNDALDIEVRNTNSSGTPFGHSISVQVLLNHENAEQYNVKQIGGDIVSAIKQNGLKDEYYVVIGYDVIEGAVSGRGTAGEPLTNAQQVGINPEFRETFSVE